MARTFPEKTVLRLDPISHKKLCFACWNGDHWGYKHPLNKARGEKVPHCESSECECSCREYLAEQAQNRARPKKDNAAQLDICNTYGTVEIK
jgi:hypothetical protein